MFEISIFRFFPTHGDQVDIDIDNYRDSFLLKASVLTASSYSNIVFHRDSDAVEPCQHSGKYYNKIYYPILKLFTTHFQMKYF